MKSALMTLAALILLGCSTQEADLLPTAPTPPPEKPSIPPAPPPPSPSTTAVTVMVYNASGGCIKGATVEIVSGQGLGQKLTQDAICSVWDNYVGGATFTGLTPRVELTVRASAPGYVSKDFTLAPRAPMRGPVMMELAPIP